jgi:hypothetical protein
MAPKHKSNLSFIHKPCISDRSCFININEVSVIIDEGQPSVLLVYYSIFPSNLPLLLVSIIQSIVVLYILAH